MKVIPESKAWDMIKEIYLDIDKEILVDMVIEFMQHTKGININQELNNEVGDDVYKVVPDSDAANILFDD